MIYYSIETIKLIKDLCLNKKNQKRIKMKIRKDVKKREISSKLNDSEEQNSQRANKKRPGGQKASIRCKNSTIAHSFAFLMV